MESRGFDVFIRCGGKQLEEYDAGEYDEEGEPTIECYIASEAGKRFTICWCEEDPGTDMIVKCYVDGQLVDTTAHFADEGSGDLQGLTISQDKYRPFMFEEVRRTSNPSISAPGTINGLFGTIVVTLTHVDYWRPARKCTKFALETVEDPRPIHVKDNVEGGHNVCFGQPTHFPRTGRRVGFTVQDPVGYEDDAEPFLCFCFIYWPKEVLLEKGIIPQPNLDHFDAQTGHSLLSSRAPRRPSEEDEEECGSEIDVSSNNDDDIAVASSHGSTVQAEVRELEVSLFLDAMTA
ncbi:hypothetical protein C8T65DRAFT_632247 [Cerioporus squamosus]|nr:hypothetical protein C8T65DRAFT_632247 [Cerioporus squamosus]